MTHILSQIGRNSSKHCGISANAATLPRSLSFVEKDRGSVISQAKAKCAGRTDGRTTVWLGTAVARFGCIIVDFSGAQAYRDGVKVPLTAHEFKVLKYFIDNPGRAISRNELLDSVWGYNAYPSTRTVDNQICKLRQKLELHPKRPSHFVTVHGIGYKFVHETFDSPVLAEVAGAQAGIQRNTGWEGQFNGSDLRNIILGYLSIVCELLARHSPRRSVPPEGAKQSSASRVTVSPFPR
jgi:DNA-binding winged helix-turn-helix (wHTH) protein